MKRIILLSVIALSLLTSGFTIPPVAEGKTNCLLGDYVIETASEPVIVDGNTLETYIIRYQNSDMGVKVGIDRSNKRRTRYLVMSDKLRVQYLAKKNQFGVKRLSARYIKEGLSTSEAALEKETFLNQKLITSKPKDDIEYLKLISVYYPKLVKNYERVFAVI